MRYGLWRPGEGLLHLYIYIYARMMVVVVVVIVLVVVVIGISTKDYGVCRDYVRTYVCMYGTQITLP